MTIVELLCTNCKHYNRNDIEKFSCLAFPDGIPEIIFETNEHEKPLPKQSNKIVFEPDGLKPDTGN